MRWTIAGADHAANGEPGCRSVVVTAVADTMKTARQAASPRYSRQCAASRSMPDVGCRRCQSGNGLPGETSRPRRHQTRVTRVLVLGGGFGGVYAARQLEKLLASDRDAEITLVSSDNFFLFTPMLHEVAASDLDITHIVSPLRTLLKRARIVIADVERIDLERRRVTVAH